MTFEDLLLAVMAANLIYSIFRQDRADKEIARLKGFAVDLFGIVAGKRKLTRYAKHDNGDGTATYEFRITDAE